MVTTGSMRHFSELNTWKSAHQMVLDIYRVCEAFPKKELFGITAQMTRAAISVTSNIAEGFGRRTYKDKIHFYYISKGSLLELENQLILAKDLGYVPIPSHDALRLRIEDVLRLLNALLRSSEEHCRILQNSKILNSKF
jgi:four helix bundle protein